jgi:hypothetical protein
MDICNHSFIGTPVRGRLTPEALEQERMDLEREARLARNSRLLQGDLVCLVSWLVAAEVARVTGAPPPGSADDEKGRAVWRGASLRQTALNPAAAGGSSTGATAPCPSVSAA